MTPDNGPEASAARTWATVLAFLMALLIVLGGVAWLTGRVGHARSEATGATAPAGVRH